MRSEKKKVKLEEGERMNETEENKNSCEHNWIENTKEWDFLKERLRIVDEDFDTLLEKLKRGNKHFIIHKTRECTKCRERELMNGYVREPSEGEKELVGGKWIFVKPPNKRAKAKKEEEKWERIKKEQKEKEACSGGLEHNWGPEHEKRWQDWGTDPKTKERIVAYDYWARVKICSICKKQRIVVGSAISKNNTEYTLEPDGTLGMCM